jgi:hypothetical protein
LFEEEVHVDFPRPQPIQDKGNKKIVKEQSKEPSFEVVTKE